MSFSAACRMLMRRWYLLIPAVLVAASGAILGATQTAPSYESQAQILLLPTASSSGASGPSNPFLNLSASLGQTAQVIAVNVMSAQSALELQASGARAAYSVVPDTSLNAPVVRVTATGPDAAAVTKTRDLVLDRFKAALLTQQKDAGAPTSTYISTRVVTESVTPAKLLKQPIRNGIIGGVFGLLIGLLPIPLSERRRISSLRSQAKAKRSGADAPVGSASVASDAAARDPELDTVDPAAAEAPAAEPARTGIPAAELVGERPSERAHQSRIRSARTAQERERHRSKSPRAHRQNTDEDTIEILGFSEEAPEGIVREAAPEDDTAVLRITEAARGASALRS